jgi:hypothetical protein
MQSTDKTQVFEAPLIDHEAKLKEAHDSIADLRAENARLRVIAHNAAIVAAQERSLRVWRPKSQKKLDRLERKRIKA